MGYSDMVMPTYRNPGRLDMASTAEAGTDVLQRGLMDLSQRRMSLPICRRNWPGERYRGFS